MRRVTEHRACNLQAAREKLEPTRSWGSSRSRQRPRSGYRVLEPRLNVVVEKLHGSRCLRRQGASASARCDAGRIGPRGVEPGTRTAVQAGDVQQQGAVMCSADASLFVWVQTILNDSDTRPVPWPLWFCKLSHLSSGVYRRTRGAPSSRNAAWRARTRADLRSRAIARQSYECPSRVPRAGRRALSASSRWHCWPS